MFSVSNNHLQFSNLTRNTLYYHFLKFAWLNLWLYIQEVKFCEIYLLHLYLTSEFALWTRLGFFGQRQARQLQLHQPFRELLINVLSGRYQLSAIQNIQLISFSSPHLSLSQFNLGLTATFQNEDKKLVQTMPVVWSGRYGSLFLTNFLQISYHQRHVQLYLPMCIY